MVSSPTENSQILIASKYGGESVHQVPMIQAAPEALSPEVSDLEKSLKWLNEHPGHPAANSLRLKLRSLLNSDQSPVTSIKLDQNIDIEPINLLKQEDEPENTSVASAVAMPSDLQNNFTKLDQLDAFLPPSLGLQNEPALPVALTDADTAENLFTPPPQEETELPQLTTLQVQEEPESDLLRETEVRKTPEIIRISKETVLVGKGNVLSSFGLENVRVSERTIQDSPILNETIPQLQLVGIASEDFVLIRARRGREYSYRLVKSQLSEALTPSNTETFEAEKILAAFSSENVEATISALIPDVREAVFDYFQGPYFTVTGRRWAADHTNVMECDVVEGYHPLVHYNHSAGQNHKHPSESRMPLLADTVPWPVIEKVLERETYRALVVETENAQGDLVIAGAGYINTDLSQRPLNPCHFFLVLGNTERTRVLVKYLAHQGVDEKTKRNVLSQVYNRVAREKGKDFYGNKDPFRSVDKVGMTVVDRTSVERAEVREEDVVKRSTELDEATEVKVTSVADGIQAMLNLQQAGFDTSKVVIKVSLSHGEIDLSKVSGKLLTQLNKAMYDRFLQPPSHVRVNWTNLEIAGDDRSRKSNVPETIITVESPNEEDWKVLSTLSFPYSTRGDRKSQATFADEKKIYFYPYFDRFKLKFVNAAPTPDQLASLNVTAIIASGSTILPDSFMGGFKGTIIMEAGSALGEKLKNTSFPAKPEATFGFMDRSQGQKFVNKNKEARVIAPSKDGQQTEYLKPEFSLF